MRKSLKALLVLAVFVLIPPIADAHEKYEKKTPKGGQSRTQSFSVNKGDSLQVSVESGDIWISAWKLQKWKRNFSSLQPPATKINMDRGLWPALGAADF